MKFATISVPDLSQLFAGDDDDWEMASVAPTEVSQDDEVIPLREPLQWEFYGLTLFLELQEFDDDLTNACRDASRLYGVERIPQPHATAIYGMTHLSTKEACALLHEIPSLLKRWPVFSKPVGVKQDIAQVGRPGQVCNIAWAELTLASNEEHEAALDTIYELFGMGKRQGPWTPHHSIAYDNPEDTVLTLADIIQYLALHPTLLTKERGVAAVSLWNTGGKMGEWECIDRVLFD